MNAPMVPKQRMKVPEFLRWFERQPDEDRYELVGGSVVAKARDTIRHDLTKIATCVAFDDAARAAELPCQVFIDGMGIAIGEQTVRMPDLTVSCGTVNDPNAFIVNSPLIVVEVSSPFCECDTVVKLIDYFAVPSIRHDLIVFSEKRVVVHHRRNEQGSLDTRIAKAGDLALDPPGLTVPVAALLETKMEIEIS